MMLITIMFFDSDNRYLIQQFFSAFSNHRTDKWGGSLEKRINFPLAVVKEVMDVV